jgi:hypothetical protein
LNLAWKYVLKETFSEPIDDSTGDLSPESNQTRGKVSRVPSSSSSSVVRMRRSFEIAS